MPRACETFDAVARIPSPPSSSPPPRTVVVPPPASVVMRWLSRSTWRMPFVRARSSEVPSTVIWPRPVSSAWDAATPFSRARSRRPLTVVTMFVPAATSRMSPSDGSVKKRSPAASSARSVGSARSAPVAGPPSPVAEPPPAGVEMTLVPAATSRIRWSPTSAMNTSPAASTARPVGDVRAAPAAGPPSPSPVTEDGDPPPANSDTCPLESTLRTTPSVASEKYHDPLGPNATRSTLTAAFDARSPSPVHPGVPVPATVLMIPG